MAVMQFSDLKPGLYRARWLDCAQFGPRRTVVHKFALVGHGDVQIPDFYINRDRPTLETDCNAELSIEVSPSVERMARTGQRFVVKSCIVREVL